MIMLMAPAAGIVARWDSPSLLSVTSNRSWIQSAA
jgi:hypothetical protein